MAGERTEQATSHRRQKAMRGGDMVQSRELVSSAGSLTGVMMLSAIAGKWVMSWYQAMRNSLALGDPARWDTSSTEPTLKAIRALSLQVLSPVAVVGISVMVGALSVAILQARGVQFYPDRLTWSFARLNPVTNIQALFSLRSITRMSKSLIPASVLAILAIQRIVRNLLLDPFSLSRVNGLGSEVYNLLMACCWILFGWSLIDYLVEWRSWEDKLKMSRQDIREEYKETEGNPQIRGRIKNLQRQSRRRRIREDVSRAAVVITNPTHYAVALSFDFEVMEAPKVLAKGRNLVAEEIKAEARWAGVPIEENPPLARSLYRYVEIGQSIPAELYAAVANILAYLYRERVERELRERRERAERENAYQKKAKSASKIQQSALPTPQGESR